MRKVIFLCSDAFKVVLVVLFYTILDEAQNIGAATHVEKTAVGNNLRFICLIIIPILNTLCRLLALCKPNTLDGAVRNDRCVDIVLQRNAGKRFILIPLSIHVNSRLILFLRRCKRRISSRFYILVNINLRRIRKNHNTKTSCVVLSFIADINSMVVEEFTHLLISKRLSRLIDKEVVDKGHLAKQPGSTERSARLLTPFDDAVFLGSKFDGLLIRSCEVYIIRKRSKRLHLPFRTGQIACSNSCYRITHHQICTVRGRIISCRDNKIERLQFVQKLRILLTQILITDHIERTEDTKDIALLDDIHAIFLQAAIAILASTSTKDLVHLEQLCLRSYLEKASCCRWAMFMLQVSPARTISKRCINEPIWIKVRNIPRFSSSHDYALAIVSGFMEIRNAGFLPKHTIFIMQGSRFSGRPSFILARYSSRHDGIRICMCIRICINIDFRRIRQNDCTVTRLHVKPFLSNINYMIIAKLPHFIPSQWATGFINEEIINQAHHSGQPRCAERSAGLFTIESCSAFCKYNTLSIGSSKIHQLRMRSEVFRNKLGTADITSSYSGNHIAFHNLIVV